MIELLTENIMLAALVSLVGLGVFFGGLLGYAAEKFKVESDPIVEQLDELLPQTQCGQCGFPGCKPYAQSIADGDAINKCPPGGQSTINAIAKLLDVFLTSTNNSYENCLTNYDKLVLNLLPESLQKPKETLYLRILTMCGYVASLTDGFALQLYKKIKG
jgi:RnfABCDGE-type electron transport complex B subunit